MPEKKPATKPLSLKKLCENICATLPDAQGLISDVLRATSEQGAVDLRAQHTAIEKKGGVSVCSHCGFPVIGQMNRCPNCGDDLRPQSHKDFTSQYRTALVSVLSGHKEAGEDIILQRMFLVLLDLRAAPTELSVDEVYRNFVTKTGKTETFRLPLKMYPNYVCNPFQTDKTKFIHVHRSHYGYGGYYYGGPFPPFCSPDHDAMIGNGLEEDFTQRVELAYAQK